MITYEQFTSVTHNWVFIVSFVAVWVLTFLLLFIIASIRKGISPGGRVSTKPMIYSGNFWLIFLVFIFNLILSIFMLFFPVYLNLQS